MARGRFWAAPSIGADSLITKREVRRRQRHRNKYKIKSLQKEKKKKGNINNAE